MKRKIALMLTFVVIISSLSACDLRFKETGSTAEELVEHSASQAISSDSIQKRTLEKPIKGKKSSYKHPLKKGQVGTCELYEPSVGANQPVNIKILRFTRGEKAKKIADAYTKRNPGISIEQLPSNAVEYAVVRYELSLTEEYKMSGESFPIVKMEVKGLNGKDLEHDNFIYKTLSSVETVNPQSISKSEVVVLQSVFAIPVGCTKYALSFGAEDGKKAIFIGK